MDYDATAKAALDAEIIKPRWYAWLDVLGDPLYATTSPVDVTFPIQDTIDPDLRGKTFEAYNPDLVNVSEVKHAVGGGGTVTASISGLVLDDNALLNLLADPANWQGRIARFWQGVHNFQNVQQGAVVPYHGGYMSSLEIEGNPSSVEGEPGTQTIVVLIESFTASMSKGSGRTYMDQQKYDPNDQSAAAALAAANNVGGQRDMAGGSGGGGVMDFWRRWANQ